MEKLVKDCSTCSYYKRYKYKREIDGFDMCKCTNRDAFSRYQRSDGQSSAYITLLDSCGPKYNFNRWKPHHKYTLKYKLEQSSDYNKVKEDDYYEVFEHTTDEVVYVWSGFCKKTPVNVKYYYIKKNGLYYECSQDDDVGFLKLENPFEVDYIKKYSTLNDAIRSVEEYKILTNQDLSLVYSTRDTLESKFTELEKANAKK